MKENMREIINMSNYQLQAQYDTDNVNDRPNQATKLISFVERFPLFHNQLKQSFISIPHKGHIENWRLDSGRFQQWLSYHYYRETRIAVSKSALNDAVSEL